MLSAWRSRRHLRRAEFAQALAVRGAKAAGARWQAWAYFRLGMYATVAALPQVPQGARQLLPALASLAACGQRARVHELLAKTRVMNAATRLRLATALAPFMPVEALNLLEPVADVVPPGTLAMLLLRTGQAQQALHLLDAALAAGAAERDPELHLHRTLAAPDAPARQLERLNHFLAAHRLPGLALSRDDAPPGPCNVHVPQAIDPVQGPLVSVLMTTYRTGARAVVAIESLLRQSWRNLEVVVADDASDDDTPQQVQALAQRDARVRLLRLPANGGTYLAKHLGLRAARGAFITCHDSDDWAHPLKIELQMQPLLRDPTLVATTSNWLRMGDDGMFFARGGLRLLRLNPASPLFRREPVLRQAGAWDCVRTGADSEFHARLKLVFGKRAVQRVALPLTLGAHRTDSLTTADAADHLGAGMPPQRLAYWEAWAHWHLDCLRRGEMPCMPMDLERLASARPFAAPEAIHVSVAQVRDALAQAQPAADTTTR